MEGVRSDRFQRVAAVSAIIVAPSSYLLMATLLQAISFDPTILATPSEFVTIGRSGAVVFKWTMVGDIFGQYLLLLPLFIFLWYWLQPRDPLLVTLLTVCGVGYIFFGALGVSINAAVLPELMRDYAAADPSRRAAIEPVFTAIATATMVGTWGIFVRVLGGLYWLGIGAILRQERPGVGYFTIIVGLLALLGAVGNVLQIGPLIGLGTLGYLLTFPAWALWLGLILYRNPQIDPITAPEQATTPQH